MTEDAEVRASVEEPAPAKSVAALRAIRDRVVRDRAEQDAAHKRAVANGFGSAMGTATELALLPGLFGALGWFIDTRLGTEPVFLVALLVFAFAGMMIRAWLGYDKEMRAQEAGLYTRLAARSGRPGSPGRTAS